MFPPALVDDILHDWEDEVRDNQFKNNRHSGKTSACPMRASHADVPLVCHEINPPQGTFLEKDRETKPYERLRGKLVPCTPHPSPWQSCGKLGHFLTNLQALVPEKPINLSSD